MRAVVQRVSESSVTIEGEVAGEIGCGLLVLVSVDVEDTEQDAAYIAAKVAGLRIFNDAAGKFNLSLDDVGGSILLISQFTLHGDCRKGRRPSFVQAARPDTAIPLYESVVGRLRALGIEVATGEFGAHMHVQLINDGPVTLLLDSRKAF